MCSNAHVCTLNAAFTRALHVPKREGGGVCSVVGAARRVLRAAQETKRVFGVSAADDAAGSSVHNAMCRRRVCRDRKALVRCAVCLFAPFRFDPDKDVAAIVRPVVRQVNAFTACARRVPVIQCALVAALAYLLTLRAAGLHQGHDLFLPQGVEIQL